ncbi:pilus assembly protein TadG-related protein [Arthrobacter sp. FX8]|uniref:pilus assembly protein TadG-related protein n=1 Tax=Arthrobacter sp. FX8 TaxID=2997335 RepID=UPI00227C6544|nr:pilus assembly protein TadG-related protein [Arthrobacter sp. FX8]WAJ31732.1 pilus assembly protein TadG-related protein [Arthrobacter sp. FX8]
MLVLIGAGALAVDVGQVYAERAQLQNGADAGALAVLDACHQTGCSQSIAEGVAQGMADGNSNDGSSTVFEVDQNVANQVTVRTTTRDGVSGAGFLRQMFSAALNAPPATVGAHATAALTLPAAAPAFLWQSRTTASISPPRPQPQKFRRSLTNLVEPAPAPLARRFREVGDGLTKAPPVKQLLRWVATNSGPIRETILRAAARQSSSNGRPPSWPAVKSK